MAKDIKGQRRRAAVAVLTPILDEYTLLQELWMQHDTLRGDSVTEIIEYVDALARRHMLDVATSKRLYGELFKAMRQPEDTLPLDPWPAMQALRPSAAAAPVGMMRPQAYAEPAQPAAWAMGAAAAPVYAQVYRPMPPMAGPAEMAMPVGAWPAEAQAAAYQAAPAQVAPAAAAPAPAPAPAVLTGSDVHAPVVFGALMRAIVDELARFHAVALDEIGNDALRVLAVSPAPAKLRESFGRAWQRAHQSDWQLAGQPTDLCELVRVVHQSLELAFGRVGADQILQRALSHAEDLPEARSFSPKRLLAAL
jgi:hypothetical protein